MKKATLLCLSLLTYSLLFSQQSFAFRYKLKARNSYSKQNRRIANNTIYEVIPAVLPGAPAPPPAAHQINLTLKCNIKINESKDTLFIDPWGPIAAASSAANSILVNGVGAAAVAVNINTSHKYFIVLNSTAGNNYGYNMYGNSMIKLNYYHRQLTATSIPVILNTKNGQIQGNPLGVNITHFWVWGRTSIYESKFVASKNSYFGLGPFAGFSVIDNASEDKSGANNVKNNKAVGLNYGGNIIYSKYNLNVIFAFGFESDFQTKNSTFPYFGLGFGFKVADVLSP